MRPSSAASASFTSLKTQKRDKISHKNKIGNPKTPGNRPKILPVPLQQPLAAEGGRHHQHAEAGGTAGGRGVLHLLRGKRTAN